MTVSKPPLQYLQSTPFHESLPNWQTIAVVRSNYRRVWISLNRKIRGCLASLLIRSYVPDETKSDTQSIIENFDLDQFLLYPITLLYIWVSF